MFSIAYRMLGNVEDAEDIVQEAFLAWSEGQREQIRNSKAYLCKIVANRCIDRIRASIKTRESYVGPWLPSPFLEEESSLFDGPAESYLHKESLSTAYLLLLQQLTWAERAVFILREVLQFDYDEIADIVGKSSANCRQIFRRARGAISGLAGSAASAPLKPEALREKVEQFVNAIMSGNTGQLVGMLKADATMYSDGGGKVTAAVRPIQGVERVVPFLLGVAGKIPPGFAYRIAAVNGQTGIVCYSEGVPINVFTFRAEGDLISEIYIVLNPDKISHIRKL
ncbi:sigma-70 family RNA polymerase sigma factor [Cohnella terricola]|uniref:Sigma-70 family RNA polymerase sigma factor n=2 Tax=Cohnella terricola TaxID=1289167 RepID=A0A559JNK4_9BACL|nr:sigma-70 family RNA polymerase sigma factor [Cohnella terricola]